MRACRKTLEMMLVTGLLWACSSNESPFKGSNLIRVVPGGRALSVVNAKTESEAQPWAAEYCSKQGLLPSFKGMSMRMRSVSADYECVASAAATAPRASAPGPSTF
jgi:hypothetical protein